MKHEQFCGVALRLSAVVHRTIAYAHDFMVEQDQGQCGVWLSRPLTDDERTQIRALNGKKEFSPGHIGIRQGEHDAAVTYLATGVDAKKMRSVILKLQREVARITGVDCIHRQLHSWRDMSRVLTPRAESWERTQTKKRLGNGKTVVDLGFFGSYARQYA